MDRIKYDWKKPKLILSNEEIEKNLNVLHSQEMYSPIVISDGMKPNREDIEKAMKAMKEHGVIAPYYVISEIGEITYDEWLESSQYE